MKKVFLVDDEIVIRENMRNCIQWEREGFDYCGDAPDGEVALPLIEEMRPDILITDIKMPFMNGLELSSIVRKRLPDTKIVILSGYDDFEYARLALRVGIEDYCLKPFSAADIIRLLRTISTKIDQELADKARIEQLKESLSAKESVSREKLIDSLASGFIASAEAFEQASQLGVDLAARYYAVFLTDIRMQLSDHPSGDEQPLIRQADALLQTRIGKTAAYLTCRKTRTERLWVIKGDSVASLQEAAEHLAGPIKSEIEQACACTLYIGVGGIHDRLQGIHLSYLEAEEDKHWRRLSGQHYRALSDFISRSAEQLVYLDRSLFIEFLKLGNPADTDRFLTTFTAGLADVNWLSSPYGFYLLSDLTLEVIREAKRLYRDVLSVEETLGTLQTHFSAVTSRDEANKYLKLLAERFWGWRAASSSRYGELIAQVKRYIQNNYGNERLSLQDAADHVRVSPSHLSKIFSQETGQTFIDYLMQTRIRKAMELLQSSNAKSYEIAYQVGYQDPHYFSNLFKRVTGMNIREFRKKGFIPPDGRTGGTYGISESKAE